MKKYLAVILTAVMLVSLIPTVTFAEDWTTVNNAESLGVALAAGGNIKLGDDIDAGSLENGSFFTVLADKTVTLDLNGKTLQGERSGTGNTEIILNKGILTIMDSVGGGKIVIKANHDDGWNSYTAAVSNMGNNENTGKLTLKSGELINLGGTAMAYALDNRSNTSPMSAHFVMEGGTLRSEYIALRLFANNDDDDDSCTATIKGGTIYGYKRGIWIHQPTADHNGEAVLKIEDGRIEATLQSAIMVDLRGTDGVDIEISGGELINRSDEYATLAITQEEEGASGANTVITGGQLSNAGQGGNFFVQDDKTTIAVSKGTFSAPVPSKFIAEGASPDDIKIQQDSEVTAKADIAYTVVIPSSVDFGTINRNMDVQQRDFTVKVEDALIEDGARIEVKNATTDMFMKDKDGTGNQTLAFTLAQEDGLFTFTQADLAEANGEKSIQSYVSCNPSNLEAAGSYKGYMTFEISYQN